ncbi:MAG: helix-turn-helix domain-containing protein, partial [Candidatus Carbobacillus sp.]|nr:helix-turn-helix domain-containing protein [Candidatus Carbobacillus sp.]
YLPIAYMALPSERDVLLSAAIHPAPEPKEIPWLLELSEAWMRSDQHKERNIQNALPRHTVERVLLQLELEQWLWNTFMHHLSFPNRALLSFSQRLQQWWKRHQPVLLILVVSRAHLTEDAMFNIFQAYTDPHALYIRFPYLPLETITRNGKTPRSCDTTSPNGTSSAKNEHIGKSKQRTFQTIALLFIPFPSMEQGEEDVHDYVHGLRDAWVQEGYESVRLIYAPPIEDMERLPFVIKDLFYSLPLAEHSKQPVINWEKHPIGWLISHLHTTEYAYLRSVYQPIIDMLNDQEMRQTLVTFIHHQGHISQTAEALYLHRNTLLYRLERIRKLSGLDPRRLDDLFLLYVILNVFVEQA